jgi:hypothetical protein
MKKVNLQLQNINGEVEKEKEITIGDNDTLIMHFPKEMTLEEAHNHFERLSNAIEIGGVVGILNTISFSIIKKEKNNEKNSSLEDYHYSFADSKFQD